MNISCTLLNTVQEVKTRMVVWVLKVQFLRNVCCFCIIIKFLKSAGQTIINWGLSVYIISFNPHNPSLANWLPRWGFSDTSLFPLSTVTTVVQDIRVFCQSFLSSVPALYSYPTPKWSIYKVNLTVWLKTLQILLRIELTFFTSHLKPSSVWPRSSSLTSPPPSLFHLLSSVTIQKEWIPPPCRQLCCFRPMDLPPPFTFPHSSCCCSGCCCLHP